MLPRTDRLARLSNQGKVILSSEKTNLTEPAREILLQKLMQHFKVWTVQQNKPGSYVKTQNQEKRLFGLEKLKMNFWRLTPQLTLHHTSFLLYVNEQFVQFDNLNDDLCVNRAVNRITRAKQPRNTFKASMWKSFCSPTSTCFQFVWANLQDRTGEILQSWMCQAICDVGRLHKL